LSFENFITGNFNLAIFFFRLPLWPNRVSIFSGRTNM